MRQILFLLSSALVMACGNSSSTDRSKTDIGTTDTSSRMPVIKDTSNTNTMNADTTGMGNAR